MRVLSIGNLWPPAGHGGYERIWVAATTALRDAGHEVRILTSDAPAPPDDAVRDLRWYSRDGEWRRSGLLDAARVERHNRRVLDRELPWADVVTWWGMGGMSLSLVDQVRSAGVPAVGVVGDGWMVYAPRHDRWPRTPDLRDAARWLFISRATAAASGFPDGEVVHPGVDPDRFPPIPPHPWRGRVAYVGRDAPGKGVPTARAAARAAGVELHVREPGDEDPATAYADADAVLFPVEWTEPWGLVPLEAMAVGRPVIATGTGGSGEYLEDGVNCLLFPPGDADALAARIRELAGDEELRRRLVDGGRATAARFTESAFCARVVAAVEAAR